MANLHQVFHVIALLAFLAALALAFVGMTAPLLFPDRGGMNIPALRTSLLLVLAAAGGLAGDWLVHNLL